MRLSNSQKKELKICLSYSLLFGNAASGVCVMLKINDIVKTDFYKKDKDLKRIVTNIKPYVGHSESGYEVTTKDEFGRILSCDMNWYTRVEV